MLEAKSLRKVVIPPTLLRSPSPGNLQSTRLAIHVNGDSSSCWVYIASGCRVYKVEVSMEDCLVTRGKESLLVPVHAQIMHSSVVNCCPHRSEIQSLVLSETECHGHFKLGTVDSNGQLIVSQLDTSGQDVDRLSYSVLPRDCGVGEGSWAGLCFSPSQLSMAAVARSFCKSVDIYDQDIHLRSLCPTLSPLTTERVIPNMSLYLEQIHHLVRNSSYYYFLGLRSLWYPSSLSFLQSSFSGNVNSLLAIAEGCQLTMWDLRIKENGGCVQRICGSPGDILYAICCSSDGLIAVGGTDRTVTIYDSRRWCPLSRWSNCSKYEITGLAFSSHDSGHIYIQGVDHEVFCGNWKENKKVFSFRGDSNWLGFNKCNDRDVLGGWCDSGSIFVANIFAKEHEVKLVNSDE